jgi:hypothetical protein
MENRPDWLDEYAYILDEIRNRLVQIPVVEEATLRYAIIRLFARTTLSMCEIYTLMNNGYPEGAFALSRQIYETIVLMDYLTTHKDDNAMIERYFDDVEITKIKTQIKIEEYSQEETKISAADALNEYATKYSAFCNTNNQFRDYWWVEKGCAFSKLSPQTNYPSDYMYKETCNVTHMSLFNSTIYIGNDQNGILIGETYDGVEKSGWYSMLCFCVVMDLFGQICAIDLTDLISRGKALVINVRKQTAV